LTPRKVRPPTPAIALSEAEAAAALSMGATLFKDEVRPHLRIIRVGSKVLFPVSELERWALERSKRVLPERAVTRD
jgi:hypothetical protein